MDALTYEAVAKMLDHSLLQPKLTDEDLDAGIRWAGEAEVASVCIKPYFVRVASSLLSDTGVAVGTVIGFPHGAHTTAVKVFEAEQAIHDGAKELDFVVNIGKVLSEDWGYVGTDIGAITALARESNVLVKVIFENAVLHDSHKVQLCQICGAVGADFVKTSTGYADGGATDHDLKLMREHAPPSVGVKAAGGVRSLDRLLEVHALGVTRVGATASPVILDEARERLPAA